MAELQSAICLCGEIISLNLIIFFRRELSQWSLCWKREYCFFQQII